jgi:hypothetical protein
VQISHEAAEEPRPVLSFERDLLVVNDEGRHRLVSLVGRVLVRYAAANENFVPVVDRITD